MGLLNSFFEKYCWTYISQLPINVCVDAISRGSWTFGNNPLNLQQYECVPYSDCQLLIVFRGAQFGRIARTEYLLSFTKDSRGTIISAKFVRDIWVIPCISTYLLDVFMTEKVKAFRID